MKKNEKNDVRRLAEQARGIRNTSLPEPIVDRIVKLSTNKSVAIGSGSALERSIRFMNDYKKDLTFFDRNGKEFTFSYESDAIRKNQTFIAVSSLPENRIRVYAHFANSTE